MKALKKILIAVVLLLMSFSMVACNSAPVKKTTGKIAFDSKNGTMLNIMTTDKFLYNMVDEITEGNQNVEYMFKKDSDMNYLVYTDDSINNISRKDLFIYLGAGLEPWSSDFVDKLAKNKVGIINASRGVGFPTYNKQDQTSIDNHSQYYWLNTDNYKIALLNIKNAIEEKDSINREYYEQNFTQELKNIDSYEKETKPIYEKCKDYTFVVDSDELDYFVKSKNIKVIKYYNYKISSQQQKDEIDKISKKYKSVNNLIFLYDSADDLKANAELISKYNMNTVSITTGDGNMDILSILKYNADNMNKGMSK